MPKVPTSKAGCLPLCAISSSTVTVEATIQFADSTYNLFYLNSGKQTVINGSEGSFVMQNAFTAIEKLSDDYKVPFMMHYEGYKYQEIANDLQLPLGTVKSRIFFARKELKKELDVYKHLGG